MNLEIISLLTMGSLAGLLAGLLGVGGGVIIVPILLWVFQQHPEFPSTHLMHLAIGTSLATIVFTSLSSILAHQRQQAIQWGLVQKLVPGILIGTWLGAALADYLPNESLHLLFALFLLGVALQLLFTKHQLPTHPTFQLPGQLGLTLVGLHIGAISALVGIGGGTITVPFLTRCQVPLRQAIATSAACGFPIALSGSLGFMAMGWELPNLPNWSTGYLYWPALIFIVPMTLLFAPLGAWLAHTLPVLLLRKFFALFLLGVSINMLFHP